MTDVPVRRQKIKSSWIFRPGVRSAVIQILLVALVVLIGWMIYRTTRQNIITQRIPCLLYTSDAADE